MGMPPLPKKETFDRENLKFGLKFSVLVPHFGAGGGILTTRRVIQSIKSNFIMKCDKRTQNIESSVRMTVQKNIKKTKHVNTNTLAN